MSAREGWAIRALAAETEVGRLRAVVAAQREALRASLNALVFARDPGTAKVILRAALDAEEVSEPPPERETAHRVTDRGGSLTSPVDTAPLEGCPHCGSAGARFCSDPHCPYRVTP